MTRGTVARDRGFFRKGWAFSSESRGTNGFAEFPNEIFASAARSRRGGRGVSAEIVVCERFPSLAGPQQGCQEA
jgi:hypothetical protein